MGRMDQIVSDYAVDHQPTFFALVEVQRFERLDHPTVGHLFG
jgi:hypothetical protein